MTYYVGLVIQRWSNDGDVEGFYPSMMGVMSIVCLFVFAPERLKVLTWGSTLAFVVMMLIGLKIDDFGIIIVASAISVIALVLLTILTYWVLPKSKRI